MPHPTHLFFDVDGVLINGFNAHPDYQNRWDTHLKQDLGIDPETFGAAFFGPSFLEIITGKRDVLEALAETLSQLGSTVSARQLLDYWLTKDSVINHPVLELVKKLNLSDKYRLFIATNQEENRKNHLWNVMGFNRYFEDIFHSAKIGITKEEPAYFEMVATLTGQQPINLLMIDDRTSVLAAAKQAGWQTFHLAIPHETKALEEFLLI